MAQRSVSQAPSEVDDDISAVRLRHPWRWVSASIVVILMALFFISAAQNENYLWGTYLKYLFDQRISLGAVVTIVITVISMLIAIVAGLVAAGMRMSENPVLRYASWLYIWVFRGTPVYVQLVFWGLFTSLYPMIGLNIPGVGMLIGVNIKAWFTPMVAACIGLGLNEGSYLSEIMRAGIMSVGEGQREAAVALGMSKGKMMRRIVMPQAMRVIIPPTGNSLIGMLKTTSLVVAIPVSVELYVRVRDISGVLYQPIPLLLVACTWYLAMTSALMVGQHFLEKHFARGASRVLNDRQLQQLAEAADKDGERP